MKDGIMYLHDLFLISKWNMERIVDFQKRLHGRESMVSPKMVARIIQQAYREDRARARARRQFDSSTARVTFRLGNQERTVTLCIPEMMDAMMTGETIKSISSRILGGHGL